MVTSGMNGYDDGRVKFIIYYRGQKIDKRFYALPIKLQETIKDKMNLMVTNNHAIFPYGW